MASFSSANSSLQRRGADLLELISSLINADACLQLRTDVAKYISETLLMLQLATLKKYNDRLELIQSQLRNKLDQIRGMSIYSPAAAQHRFTVNAYTGLEELWLYQSPPSTVKGLFSLRKGLVRLIIEYSGIVDLADVLSPVKYALRCALHPMILTDQPPVIPVNYQWSRLTSLKVVNCGLVRIDEAMHFFPNLIHLDLSHNSILHIVHLQDCIQLQSINLSYNRIRVLSNLERVLGKVKKIDLSNNEIQSLDGVDKVYSLEIIDISNNYITDIVEVHHLGRLPCLEQLLLVKNPIADLPHYRIRVFGIFIQVGSIMSGNRSFPVLDKFAISPIEMRQLRKLMFRSPVNDLTESTYTDLSTNFDMNLLDYEDKEEDEEEEEEEDEAAVEGDDAVSRVSSVSTDIRPQSLSAFPEARGVKRTSSIMSSNGRTTSRYSIASMRDKGGKRLSIESRLSRFSTALSDTIPVKKDVFGGVLRKSPMRIKPLSRTKVLAQILDTDERAACPTLAEVDAKLKEMVEEYTSYYLIDPIAAMQAKKLGLPMPNMEDNQQPVRPVTPTRPVSVDRIVSRQNSGVRTDSSSPTRGMDHFIGKLGENSQFVSFSAPLEESHSSSSDRPADRANDFEDRMSVFGRRSFTAQAPESSASTTMRIMISKPSEMERISEHNSDLIESADRSSLPSEYSTSYIGDPQYRDLIVSENLELYFREQVFSANRPCHPKFFLRGPGDEYLQPYEQDERLVCIYTEKMIDLTDISLLPPPSTPVPLNRAKSKKNIPSDEGYPDDDDEPVKESLTTLILTDVGLYILDHAVILSKKLVFADAPVFSVLKAHPLYTLGGLAIFFGFQRFSLVFMENPSMQSMGRKSVYLVITRDKARTYPMITRIPQVANVQRASHSLLKLTNVKIENKDGQLLEQVMAHIHSLGTSQDDIVHYQLVYQVFKERPTVRLPRTVIITQSSIILCKENLLSNNVELSIIDSYNLKDIQQIFAEENALFLTVIFKRTTMLARRRKWRFCTDARNPSSKLLEECKRACLEIGNDGV